MSDTDVVAYDATRFGYDVGRGSVNLHTTRDTVRGTHPPYQLSLSYEMSGTARDISVLLSTRYEICSTETLRAVSCYALATRCPVLTNHSGTDKAYAATRVPVLTVRMLLPGHASTHCTRALYLGQSAMP
eukprot:157564-Rhodomonas_salina.4